MLPQMLVWEPAVDWRTVPGPFEWELLSPGQAACLQGSDWQKEPRGLGGWLWSPGGTVNILTPWQEGRSFPSPPLSTWPAKKAPSSGGARVCTESIPSHEGTTTVARRAQGTQESPQGTAGEGGIRAGFPEEEATALHRPGEVQGGHLVGTRWKSLSRQRERPGKGHGEP